MILLSLSMWSNIMVHVAYRTVKYYSILYIGWVSEPVIVSCQKSNLSAISWQEQVTLEEMMMMFDLSWTNTLSWIYPGQIPLAGFILDKYP